MIAKGIDFTFTYATSSPGNLARDTFKVACDSEMLNDNALPVVNTVRSADTIVNSHTVTGKIYYNPTNSGKAAMDTFYATLQTEKAKSTVTFAWFVQYSIAPSGETFDLVTEVKNPVS